MKIKNDWQTIWEKYMLFFSLLCLYVNIVRLSASNGLWRLWSCISINLHCAFYDSVPLTLFLSCSSTLQPLPFHLQIGKCRRPHLQQAQIHHLGIFPHEAAPLELLQSFSVWCQSHTKEWKYKYSATGNIQIYLWLNICSLFVLPNSAESLLHANPTKDCVQSVKTKS